MILRVSLMNRAFFCKSRVEVGKNERSYETMSKRFILKSKQHLSGGIIKIVVDTETGVNYLMTSGIGLNGMTPLLDKDGKVVIDKPID